MFPLFGKERSINHLPSGEYGKFVIHCGMYVVNFIREKYDVTPITNFELFNHVFCLYPLSEHRYDSEKPALLNPKKIPHVGILCKQPSDRDQSDYPYFPFLGPTVESTQDGLKTVVSYPLTYASKEMQNAIQKNIFEPLLHYKRPVFVMDHLEFLSYAASKSFGEFQSPGDRFFSVLPPAGKRDRSRFESICHFGDIKDRPKSAPPKISDTKKPTLRLPLFVARANPNFQSFLKNDILATYTDADGTHKKNGSPISKDSRWYVF
jgi:hypothetical protein